MTETPSAFEVRSHLMGMIRAGKLGPNGRLPTERELCVGTGAGRRLVRRVLASLEAEGLIWRRQGKGTFAGQPIEPVAVIAREVKAASEPIEVMEARLSVEPEIAALCARRAQPDEVERMRRLAQRRLEAGDDQMIELWDSALHRQIAKSAHNQPLLTVFAILDESRSTDAWQGVRPLTRSEQSLRETERQHLRIIAAIEAGDEAGARAAMRDHLITRYEAMLREATAPNAPPSPALPHANDEAHCD
ncbi:MAG: FadR family transcriptional regulator [Rhodobacteraceae bacterium]|nr:FadR family transcriptional regulator [Paracoccaceae bacterium]